MISEAENRNHNRKYGWKKRPTTFQKSSSSPDRYARSSSSSSSAKFMRPSDDSRVEKNMPVKESSSYPRQVNVWNIDSPI